MSVDHAAAGPLAVVCGAGSLPYAVADAVQSRGRKAVLFPIRGFADAASVARYPHEWIALGQFGRLRRLALAAGCREIVLIGGVVRPSLREVRLDWRTIGLLPKLVRLYRGGDDHLLSGIERMFADEGLTLLGAHEVAPEILMPAGPLGRIQPNEAAQADIALGLQVLAALGPFDIGQAVVVDGLRVVAVEAAEGTDGVLARVAQMRKDGRLRTPPGRGVLVKAPKPGQNHRIDLPTIGPRTIEGAAESKLGGIAVAAGGVLIAQPEEVAAAADKAGLFVLGTDPTSAQ